MTAGESPFASALLFGAKPPRRTALLAASAINGLGATPYQSWAFRRAELTAFVESPFLCTNGRPAIMAPVRTFDPRTVGAPRLGRLLFEALQSMRSPLRMLPRKSRVAVHLSLPQWMAPQGRAPEARGEVEAQLSRILSELGLVPEIRTYPGGASAGARAAAEAAAQLQSGQVAVALCGGVDSSHDPFVVQNLIEDGRIFDGENPSATVQGEGASLALLSAEQSVDALARQGLAAAPLAWIEGVGFARDEATAFNEVPSTGLGLTAAARCLTRSLGAGGLGWWLTDLTAEPLRLHEFQLAFPRITLGVMGEQGILEHLPEHFGALGAATLATGAAIATEAFTRGDPAADTCLLTASCDDGSHGALLLRKVT